MIKSGHTECMECMSHRKRRETKQQPSMLPGPAMPGCCLVSFHFLSDIHSIHSVHFAALVIALGQALEWSDKALTERRESEVYQEELNAGVDYALVSFLPSFLGTLSISYRGASIYDVRKIWYYLTPPVQILCTVCPQNWGIF